MAKSPVPNGQSKPKRPRQLGPRTLWLILKPGTDAEQVRESIEKVTFNGRTVLQQLGSGTVPPTVKFTVDIEKRGGVQTGASESVDQAESVLEDAA